MEGAVEYRALPFLGGLLKSRFANVDSAPMMMEPTALENLWTIDDVARYFKCTTRHVRNLMANGLPCCYLGRLIRFEPNQVRSFIQSKPRLAATITRRARRDAARLAAA